MNKLLNIFLCFLLVFSINSSVFANLDFSVTPTKYEIEALKWTKIKRTAKIYNYSNETYTIFTWKSDFTTWWNTWVPKIVRRSELAFPDQQLASWIEIEETSFEVEPFKHKEISFYINVPEDATPGWHYWAVFFKKQSSNLDSNTEVWINLDYWILVIMNVDWEIIMKWWPEEIAIIMDEWIWKINEDDCFIDFTDSNFDWKCFENPFKDDDEELTSAPENPDEFNTYFDIPFKNEWNTHIKPTWKIILLDDDWNQLKWIWRVLIKNEKWAIVWEKIVDYLPINDEEWNVLPYSTRNFKLTWEWFSYKTYDEEWNEVIKFWSPWDYYTKKNVEERWFIMFWEKIAKRVVYKEITAVIDISYFDKEWQEIKFSEEKSFDVSYMEDYIAINYYVVSVALMIALFLLIIFFIILIRRKKCQNCNKKISRNMKVCPYCWEKVNNENNKYKSIKKIKIADKSKTKKIAKPKTTKTKKISTKKDKR